MIKFWLITLVHNDGEVYIFNDHAYTNKFTAETHFEQLEKHGDVSQISLLEYGDVEPLQLRNK